MRHASLIVMVVLLGTLGGCAQQKEVPYGSDTPATAPAPGGPAATGDLAALKTKLAAEGKYACCVKSPCDLCAKEHQSCSCSADLKAGKGVCGECFGNWKAGQGNVAGIDPATVTQSSEHEHGPGEGH